jgi:dynein heavy chain
MSSLEMSLMEIHVNDMNKVLSPGFTTLYWSSQRISAYIAVAFHALEKFRSTLGEVRKHSSSIENIIKQIEQESLIDIDSDFALNSLGDFTDAIEDSVRRKVSKSMLQYKSIKPLLIKIEMAVSESDKGFSTLLESSYNYWTKRVYNALVQMTCRSTFSLFMMLRAFHTKSTQCHLNITVYDKEVIMEPSLSEIQKYFGRCFRTLTEASRQFFRWMSQTCLNATSSLESGDSLGLEHRYSFYRDVSQNSAIVSSFTGLNYGLQLLTRDLNAYLQYWKIIFKDYDIFDSGWKMELDNGIQSNIPASLFDHNINECERKLLHFRSLAFGKSDLVVNLCQHLCIFRLVDTTEVKRFLVDAINERKLDVGDVLHTEGKQNLESIQEAIESYRGILCSEPGSLHELKTVIKGIARIQNSNMQMELQCKDLCDKYNVLRGRDIFVPQEEMSQAFASYSHWHNLLIHAKTINLQLTDFKNDFKHRLTRQSADFKSKLKLEITRYHEEGPGCSTISLDQGLIKFDEWKTNLVRLKSIKEDLADSEDVLGMTNTPYADFIAIENSMYELTQIYDLYKDLNEVFQMQRTIAWLNVDIDSFRTKLDVLVQQSENIRIECNRPTWDKVHSRIIDLKDTIPILRNLQNDSFKDRHWEQLGEITKSHSQPLLKNLTLFDILTMNLHRIPSEVDEVLNSSLQEQKIQNGLFLIIDYWASANLLTKEYTGDTSGNFILSSMDDTVIQLEDHLLNLQAMLGSKFSGVFRDDIKRWEKRLNLIIECLNLWFKLQQKWMYLESIFIGAEDIRMQLQKETKIFDETSRGFQLIMKKTNEIPNIVNACSQERLLTFTKLLEVLESCQKSLSEYLNTKRAAFARFYFISDEEMISILGNSDPSSIEPHLLKLFDNTKTLMFSQGHRKITGLKSSEGESVQLIHDVDSIGPVEVWMQHFEDEIKHTLHSKMKESTFYYATQSRETWIKSNLGMCTISSSQVWWTWQVEDAFSLIESGDKQALQKLETKLSTQLSDMVAMVRSSLNDNTRRKVNSLLITDVHARDIVSSFVRESVLSAKEFEWESQLRFYWKKDHDDLMIQQCIGSFHYGYEYLGLCARLVITPLTDRCYMTLTQALTFKLGGSPSGPAGTGKVSALLCV